MKVFKHVCMFAHQSALVFCFAAAVLIMQSGAFFFGGATILTTGRAIAPATATMRVSGIESTPNPSSFKFALDESISSGGGNSRGITYSKSSNAARDTCPEQILRVLELPDVESVYAMSDWVCINKKSSAKWDAIVPSAVEFFGGAAESLDPRTLTMASGGDGGSTWQSAEMDGIAIRLQVSNGIPIQVEACPPGGSPLRRKLSSRFVDAMAEFVGASGDEMSFFRGRKWLPRGVWYPTDGAEMDEYDEGSGIHGTAERALAAAVEEVELAYHESRLRGAVQDALALLRANAEGGADAAPGDCRGSGEDGEQKEDDATAATAEVRAATAVLQSPSAKKEDIIGSVDLLCGLAGNDKKRIARDALDTLIGFAGSGGGPVAARRAAVAFIGSVGDAAGSAGLDAVAAVFRGDKNAGVRRTAGDALSDLGDSAAIPIAVVGLHDKSKLVRWRAARVVGELGCREHEAVSLDEAREGEAEFEVAFEMADAARKIRARVAGGVGGDGDGGGEGGGDGGVVTGVGPVWKRIQERGGSK